jgi:hypothetical protein
MIVETSQFVGLVTLTTVNKIEFTYTEQQSSAAIGWPAVIGIAAIGIIVAIALLARRRKGAEKSPPASTAKTVQFPSVVTQVQAGKICPKCQGVNDSEADFCVSCGHKL